MEVTCQRCHQPVLSENCFCPSCGLPQLVYAADDDSGQHQPEYWADAVRDASSVEWKPAIRAAIVFAVPAGLLCSGISPVSILGIFWMAAAAAWAVTLYARRQKPAWITMGAGARIGLVTGILGGWLACSISGGALFVQRYALHQSAQMDSAWASQVIASQEMAHQWTAEMGQADAKEAELLRTQVQAWMMSPWGHAGIIAFSLAGNAIFLLLFAAGGGAIGARLLVRPRTEI